MRRAAGGPERRRAAPLLLGGDAAVPARCKLGYMSAAARQGDAACFRPSRVDLRGWHARFSSLFFNQLDRIGAGSSASIAI